MLPESTRAIQDFLTATVGAVATGLIYPTKFSTPILNPTPEQNNHAYSFILGYGVGAIFGGLARMPNFRRPEEHGLLDTLKNGFITLSASFQVWAIARILESHAEMSPEAAAALSTLGTTIELAALINMNLPTLRRMHAHLPHFHVHLFARPDEDQDEPEATIEVENIVNDDQASSTNGQDTPNTQEETEEFDLEAQTLRRRFGGMNLTE